MRDGTVESHHNQDRKAVRVDGLAKITASSIYAYDHLIAGALHAKVVRSSVARARVLAIDTAVASALPGVVRVITFDDLIDLPVQMFGYGATKDQPLLAGEHVRHFGEAVALVVAVDEATAVAAVDLVSVEYDPLEPVTSVDEALGPDVSNQLAEHLQRAVEGYGIGTRGTLYPEPNVFFEFEIEYGDNAVLHEADEVFTDTFSFTPCQHYHLEPFTSTVAVGVDGVEIWTGTQNPFVIRKELARILARPESSVRIHAMPSGGGFGARNGCRTEHLAALASLVTGRPVRLQFTLDESFFVQRQHGATISLTTGVRRDGTVAYRQGVALLDSGAYVDASVLVTEKAGFRLAGPYSWGYVHSVAKGVMTNTAPAGPFRGFGGPQSQWASESQIDMIARRLGIDPVEFRRMNLLRRGERYVPTDSPMDSSMHESLERVVATIGRSNDGRHIADPWKSGFGFAVGFKDAGGINKAAQARVKLLPHGEIVLHSATLELGQGAHTALSAIVAEVLATPIAKVRYARVDTELSPFDKGTNASSAVAVMGSAVRSAAMDLRETVLRFAAKRLGYDIDDLEYADGEVIRDEERWALEDLVLDAYGGTGYEFQAEGEFQAPSGGDAPFGTPCLYWETGAAAARVLVNIDTGEFRLTDLVTAADAGKMIDEQLCHGQDEGAAVMSVGHALFERMRYTPQGEPSARFAGEYRVPRSTDLPTNFTSIISEDGRGPGPFGARGFGEANMLSVPAAICNALRDAVGFDAMEIPVLESVLWSGLQVGAQQEAGVDT